MICDFAWALERLKEGKQLTRISWNFNQRIFLITGRTVDYNTFYSWKNNACQAFDPPQDVVIRDHIDMKMVDGTYLTGWTPSQDDLFADDWVIVERKYG